MWFKYFHKGNWNLRIWRTYNLKFDANEFGFGKHMHLAHLQAFIMKIARTEAPVRTFNIFLLLGSLKAYSYLTQKSPEQIAKEEREAEEQNQRELEQERAEYREKLFLNRYQSPTKPTRSVDDLITFAGYRAAIDDAIDYMSLNETTKTLHDFERGLDTWLGEEDRKMMLYAKKFKAEAH